MSNPTVSAREVKRAAATIDAIRPKNERPGSEIVCQQSVVVERAAQVITHIATAKAIEADVKVAKDFLRGRLDGVVARAGRTDDTPTTVRIPTDAGDLLVSYKDAYKDIKLEKVPQLQEIIGDDFDRLFELRKTLKIRAAAIKADEDLASVVNELTTALGKERFLELFDASLSVSPTSEFTVRRFRDLTSVQLKQLEDVGVEQTAAFTVAKS